MVALPAKGIGRAVVGPLTSVSAFADAGAAIEGADRVHIAVSDEAAVDSVLAAAKPTGLVIDHTTTSIAIAALPADRSAAARVCWGL